MVYASVDDTKMLWIVCGIPFMEVAFDSSGHGAIQRKEWGLHVGLNLNLSSTSTNVALDPIEAWVQKYQGIRFFDHFGRIMILGRQEKHLQSAVAIVSEHRSRCDIHSSWFLSF